MKTSLAELKLRVHVDEPDGINLPGFYDGMLLAYSLAHLYPLKIETLTAEAEQRFKLVTDNRYYTDFDENAALGTLAAYRRAVKSEDVLAAKKPSVLAH